MAEDWCGKTRVDVEVSVRPLEGFWLRQETASASTDLNSDQQLRGESSTTSKTTSGATLSCNQKVIYKREDDPAELKCLWKADSTESYFVKPSSLPMPATPSDDPVQRKGWNKALGPVHKATTGPGKWKPALSLNKISPKVSTRVTNDPKRSRSALASTTVTSSKDTSYQNCGCRYQGRKRRRRGHSDESRQYRREEKKQVSQTKEEPKKVVFPVPSPKIPVKTFADEVAVEPAFRRPEEKVPYYILWELKAWTVLLFFWLLLFVYRYSTTA